MLPAQLADNYLFMYVPHLSGTCYIKKSIYYICHKNSNLFCNRVGKRYALNHISVCVLDVYS